MARYGNNAVAEDHVGANPISGLMWELRRTAGNIIALEEELEFLSSQEMIESETIITKRALQAEIREIVGTVEDDEDEPSARTGEEYVITKREPRIHLWNELYLRERKQYTEVTRLMFAVGFEKKRIEMIQANIADFNGAITGILRALGHDPNDPVIRQIVRQQIIAVMPTSIR